MAYQLFSEKVLDDLAGRPSGGFAAPNTFQRRTMRKEAHRLLKEWTGQDFGYDEAAWREWMKANPDWDANPLPSQKAVRKRESYTL